jgi:hypothetical protein
VFRISSSDDESSSTLSNPNDPPYVLRGGGGGAAMTRAADFGFVLASISSIRGLGFIDDDDDDDDVPFCPTVSQDLPAETDFLVCSRSSR